MPLIHSASPSAIGPNIRREEDAGRPYRQALAIALNTQDRARHRAAGGSAGAPAVPTYQTAASNILPSGLVPVPQVGAYGLDPTTGALTPAAQMALQAFAQRGLPIGAAASPPPQASAAVQPTPATIVGDWANNGGPGKRGGRPEHFAAGGVPTSAEMAPWYVRSEARGMDHAPGGLVHTAGPGRTDNVPMSVAAGSHVIPADVVAGIGEGNTLSGAHALDAALHSGPGGIRLPNGPHRATLPRPPAPPKLARGGKAAAPQWGGRELRVARGGVPGGVKCIVAGGEYILRPEEVQRIEHKGKRGHDAVDAWILERRRETVHKLRKLPGPVK